MGARWRQHRRAAIKAAPFCAVCGTSKRLQVHHITPRRKGGGQEPSNLIPLCVGHHKTIEVMTVEALHACPDDLASAMEGVALRLRIRQSATAQVLARVRAAA